MVVVVMGVSGSGKTTVGKQLAQKLGFEFHDADDFHPPANVEKMSRGIPLDDRDREPWLSNLRQIIDDRLQDGRGAVVTCSALKEAYRLKLGIERPGVRLVYLKGDFDTIQDRIQDRRKHFMPPGLLASQFEALEEPPDALTVEVRAKPRTIVSRILRRLK